MDQDNTTTPAPDCRTCRFHSSHKRNKVVDVAFDEIIEWSDDMETVYSCTSSNGPHAGQEVGTTPVKCFSFSPTASDKASALSRADEMLAKFEERHRNKEKDGR